MFSKSVTVSVSMVKQEVMKQEAFASLIAEVGGYTLYDGLTGGYVMQSSGELVEEPSAILQLEVIEGADIEAVAKGITAIAKAQTDKGEESVLIKIDNKVAFASFTIESDVRSTVTMIVSELRDKLEDEEDDGKARLLELKLNRIARELEELK